MSCFLPFVSDYGPANIWNISNSKSCLVYCSDWKNAVRICPLKASKSRQHETTGWLWHSHCSSYYWLKYSRHKILQHNQSFISCLICDFRFFFFWYWTLKETVRLWDVRLLSSILWKGFQWLLNSLGTIPPPIISGSHLHLVLWVEKITC